MGTEVIIAIGTNTNQTTNFQAARTALSGLLVHPIFTNPIWTKPIGIASDNFLNALAKGFTHLSYTELFSRLKQIESSQGDESNAHTTGTVNIDLDILLYGSTKHHANDWQKPYIKSLLNTFIIK